MRISTSPYITEVDNDRRSIIVSPHAYLRRRLQALPHGIPGRLHGEVVVVPSAEDPEKVVVRARRDCITPPIDAAVELVKD